MLARSLSVALILGALAAPGPVVSQQAPSSQPASPTLQHPVAHYYRLNFVLRELEEGKLINQRAYTLSAASEGSESSRLRSGTRVPVTHDKDTSYFDLGVNLDVRAKEVAESLQLEVTAEISSTSGETSAPGVQPVIRQVRSHGTILAAIGKPIMVFTADDPASRHRFELEVTPLRER